MGKAQKKRIKMALSFLLIILMLINEIPLCAKAEEKKGKEKAVLWLQKAANTKQEWEDHGLPNLTCNAMAVLREEGEETDSSYLKEWERSKEIRNLDEQVHLAWAWGYRNNLDIVWGWQNSDGGFGVAKDYTSDVYDTLLVLLAESAVRGTDGLTGEEELKNSSDAVWVAADYLAEQQRADGGFGYTKADEAVPGLSAEIGIALLSLNIKNDEFYEKLDQYCRKAFVGDFSEENFYVQAELARYLYRRDKIENTDSVETELYKIQKENGSIYDSAENTIQYILLLNEIEEYHTLKFAVKSLVTEADTYVLEVNEEQEVALQTTVQYNINQKMTGTVCYTLLEDERVVEKKEQECMFVPNQNTQIAESIIRLTAAEGKEYVLRTEVISKDREGNDTVWERKEFRFTLHKRVENELVLQAETSQAEDYGVNLSWNDISNDDVRYGYRIFRKKENSDWETQSTWDGEEKVKVLNIYPCNTAKDYLVDWMEDTVSGSEEPAGKGLFEIDTVNIDDYNRTPERYLMDEDGNYLYDVLVFGTYDSNAFADVSEKAYDATQKYLDSGRGVLFGHDTVAEYHGNHKTMFPRFGERLGIKLIRDGYLHGSDKVNVVKSGILTNYPWKLTGTLTIPTSHVAGQYAGGTLPSTVWLEFQNDCLTDEETGAKNNAYLLSRNSMAVIQTGHSNGQATDDERKVLANTLFYLKQWTDKTSAADKSFYDEAAPKITSVSDASADKRVTIQGKDNGTPYQYYTEAVNAGNREAETKKSNIVKVQAVSGVQGFIVGTSDSEGALEELLDYDEEGNLISEIFPAVNGSLVYTIDGLETGDSTYLHIYAVDYAYNVSEETVCQVTIPERKSEEETETSEKETEISEEKLEISEKETAASEEEQITSEEKQESSKKKGKTSGEEKKSSETTQKPLEEKEKESREEGKSPEKQKLSEKDSKTIEKEYFHNSYAMFASGNSTVIRCQKADIKGSIYGSNLFRFQGKSLTLKGSVFSNGRLLLGGRRIVLGKKAVIPKVLPLPDYTEAILRDIEKEYGNIEKQKICKHTGAKNPYRCDKADVSGCSQVNITAGLVSDENVRLNAPVISCGKEKPVVLCSRNGNISIETLRFSGNGLIYAPNGTVTIRASEISYTGTILARKIRIQADRIKINQQGENAYDK